jgi:hypothetical protein
VIGQGKKMKSYVDVKIRSGYERDEELVEAIHKFADDTDGWKFLTEQSKEYASFTGEGSCAVLRALCANVTETPTP